MYGPATINRCDILILGETDHRPIRPTATLPRRCRGLNYATPVGVKTIVTDGPNGYHAWSDRPQRGHDMLAHGGAVGALPCMGRRG